ncbi:hypothetical protein [Cellulomonas pakistanensis]|uniref:Uncharacterized protein n=1 Tax=Cellulomonas pakistanensis TaxID=992287 RepID=A0A919P9N7_9CELL|nr:hypothetical protein [Cellulomonas pakistanensis]GIG36960.1 hypothetical protein Cpa01nite_23410 [Cellulomonas pakistanensis]
MGGVDPAFARSVDRWLRAYPRRWRAARAGEITAVLADLAEPGARRLDLRSGLGLVRAGWATRWREHPPLLAYLGYVLLELRLDPRYRDWVRDDLDGPWYTARQLLRTSPVLVVVVVLGALDGNAFPSDALPVFAPTMLGMIALYGRQWTTRTVARQLVVQPGEVVTPSGLIPGRVARPRIEARSWLAAARLVALVTLGACAVVLALAPRRVTAVVDVAEVGITSVPVDLAARAGATGLAVLGAAVGVALARRTVPARLRAWQPMAQPYRWLVPLGPVGRTRLAALVACCALLAAAQPSLAAALAGPVAAVAAAALPVLAAARRALGTGGTAALAGIDLVRALREQGDRGDAPVDGHLPAASWLPVGAVVPRPGDPVPTAGTDLAGRG